MESGPQERTPGGAEAAARGAAEKIALLRHQGFEVMQVDESVFTPKRFNPSFWAPSGNPLPKADRWGQGDYVACVAAISAECGLLYWECKKGAYKKETFVDFLKAIRGHYPQHKLAVFVYNASIHKWASQTGPGEAELQVELVFNLPYRPDLMGVERTCAVAKRHYRKYVGSLRPYSYLSHRWDPVCAVKGCM